MARTVRAVSDGERKYAGFCPSGRRRINGEVFEWPNGRDMPVVRRDEDGLIIGGWVELVSGEDEGPPAVKPPKAKIPGLVDGKKKGPVMDGNALSGKGRASDRVIG